MKYVQPMSLPPTDDDREFEHSPLSGTFSRDGGKVDVEIYRYAGTQEPWRLEVIDLSSGRCTAWLATFATDQEAFNTFAAMVEADGMASFAASTSTTSH
ncbi:hypothetical protein PQI07_10910 [Methylobacterium sp. 092160098-2]|uniref:hypothetical protein n=1 Tax=Methylobacterium TaxID=407 RepID=UPI001F39A28D|nr:MULTISPECIES: hypothetical protein [Methylobacterium]MDE4911204.1 hypothetical protein [Methylobacterium sp. 092160098-2]